jgi:hypothetical protein
VKIESEKQAALQTTVFLNRKNENHFSVTPRFSVFGLQALPELLTEPVLYPTRTRAPFGRARKKKKTKTTPAITLAFIVWAPKATALVDGPGMLRGPRVTQVFWRCPPASDLGKSTHHGVIKPASASPVDLKSKVEKPGKGQEGSKDKTHVHTSATWHPRLPAHATPSRAGLVPYAHPDAHPLQPTAMAFVSNGFVLVRVRVRMHIHFYPQQWLFCAIQPVWASSSGTLH